MSEAFFKQVYIIGSRVRRTRVLGYLDRLNESQFWSGELQRRHQLDRLRALLEHAQAHAPFYRARLEKYGIGPGEIETLDDLQRIPPVSKEEILAHRDTIQNDGLGEGLVCSETSGSTGEPLVFYRDLAWDAQHRAAIARGCRWYGVVPWMRSGLLWGIPSNRWRRLHVRFEDFFQNRFRERRFDLSDETLEAFCRRLRGARFLEGYSSMIYELARYMNERRPGGDAIPLRLVKATSEKIYPHYQREAQRAFGRRMTSEYGAAETGIIAFECPTGTMHVNTDHVIVEVEGREVIVTNLLSFSFPFIRYRLGDYVKLREHVVCACGREGPAVDEVSGRVGRRIYGSGERIFPSLTIYYVIDSLAAEGDLLVRCQAVQRERGRLDVRLVLRPDATMHEQRDFAATFDKVFRHYFGSDIEYDLGFVDDIPRTGQKHVDFVSEISED
jgi:phenylacetate-CoA ligase